MFDDVLIESAGKDKNKGTWVTAMISAVVHFGIVGAVVAAGMYVKEHPEIIERPISAFIVTTSPPPPPPPPPPPASNAGATQTPRVEVEQPRERPREFRQPTDTPQDIPRVADVPSTSTGSTEGGVVGGVEGGVVDGVVGGDVGGVRGGTLRGTLGGQLGGTGTGDAPVHVGGNVKAPTIVSRVDPEYTEVARRAKVVGVVIIEAVIDRQGNVTEARVLKPLPMGLDQSALAAVRKWKFRPGTLNGQPVPVYFSLTVSFRLE